VGKKGKVVIYIVGFLALLSTIWSLLWMQEALNFTASYVSFEGKGVEGFSGLTYIVTGGTRPIPYYGETSIMLLLPFVITLVLIIALLVLSQISFAKDTTHQSE
jgi:hypothetical protein